MPKSKKRNLRRESELARKSGLSKLRRLLFEQLEPRQMLAGDSVFFTKDTTAGNDRLISVDGLTRGAGTVNLSTQPGYVNVNTGETGLNPRVIDAGFVNGSGVVAIGGDLVQSFSATNIANQFGTAWDPDGGGSAAGVDALAIGDFGTQSHRIVIARETSPAANDILVMATDALNTGANVHVAGGPTSGGTAHGLALADFQTATTGNEALFGFVDPSVGGGNGHQLFYNTSGNSGQFFLSRFISDVAAGNLNASGDIDYILTGLNSPGQLEFGQGSLVYEANGAGGSLLDTPGLAGPHNPPWFNAAAIGNMDNDSALEVVLAGNDFVRVLDNNGSGDLDFLPPLFESSPLGGGVQFVDVTIADADSDSVNEIIAVTDTGLVYMFGHSVIGDVNSAFSASALGIYDTGADSLLGVASLEGPAFHAYVTGRNVFYNNSSFDGNDPSAGTSDDQSIATDKQALLPSGTATFSNYTSFDQGINGAMIDIQNLALPGALSLSDFQFRAGNADEPFPWNLAPQPVNNIAADIRLGEGAFGSDRITLIWNANDIEKEWLEIRVKATANTGLVFDDVFYVGNAIGETGNSASDALVDATDVADTIANPHGPFDQAAIIDAYDFNRDGLVTAADILIARDNGSTSLDDLELLVAPLPEVSSFRIVEENGHWLRLEESGGTGWNFNYFSDAGVEIDSALSINIDNSPLDFYLADEPGGTFLFLAPDGQVIPDLPHTGIKPTFGVFGDILAEDIYAIERNPMTHFLREQANVSASASTMLHAAQGFQDMDGGAGIILHPDHDQDLVTFPGDPADHPDSGAVKLIAYGQGTGSRANAIIFSTRDGVNSTAERMVIQDGTVNVFGNIHASGSITPGSSSGFKQDLADLSFEQSLELIQSLDAISFAYIADPNQPRLGFIAEEVPKIFGTENRKGVDPMGIATALTVILQQQRETIDEITQLLESAEIDTESIRTAILDLSRSHPSIVGGPLATGSSAASSSILGASVGASSTSTAAANSEGVAIAGNLLGSASSNAPLAAFSPESIISDLELPTFAASTSDPSTELTAASSHSSWVAASHAVNLPVVTPFQVTESGNEWIELQNSSGTNWNFDHFSNPGLGIGSALSVNVDSSPLDFYLADETGGANIYLWEDGRAIPNLVLTGDKPDFALFGDMLVGDIVGNGREAISHFRRVDSNLSAQAATVLFSAGQGINSDTDGGAGILLRPDHHQDVGAFPGDATTNNESGTLQLTAYGVGSGAYANAIVFQTRDGVDSVADRMIIKDGTVNVFGEVVASGTITSGSSREIKQDIQELAYDHAAKLVELLDAVSFAYHTNPEQPRLGFLAEEVPEEFGTADRKAVDAMGITASLVSIAQQQQAEIDALYELLQPIQVGAGVDALGEVAHSSSNGYGSRTMSGAAELTTLVSSLSTSNHLVANFLNTLQPVEANPVEANPDESGPVEPHSTALPNAQQGGWTPLPLTSGDEVPAFTILENADQWMRLEETGGTGWNFSHVANPALGIDSALSINIDGSPRDLYFADEPGGLGMYLWDDGVSVPNLPHTGVKPTFAISGNMLVGDLILEGREARTMFMREQTNLSASASTTLYSSLNGLNDVDGGAAIIMHPDHNQDTYTFPGDPVDHNKSGALELIAYGQGTGTFTNGIRINSKFGPNNLAERMLIKDGLVSITGNLVATGTITPGSSQEFKQDISNLSYSQAADLIFNLDPVSFVYSVDPSQPRLGFVAEEVPLVFGNAQRNGVDAMGITSALTVVVQQQQQQLAQLSQWVDTFITDAVRPSANLPGDLDLNLGATTFLTFNMLTTERFASHFHGALSQVEVGFNNIVTTTQERLAPAMSEAFAHYRSSHLSELQEFGNTVSEEFDEKLADLWGENADWLRDPSWDGVV